MGAKQKSSRHIPERFLRQLWNHKLFATDNLRTTDGRPLEILYVGRINHDSGPDFLDARIRIGNLIFFGNIELHKHFSGWNDHGHHRDPRYNAVILHVVFSGKPLDPPPRTKSRRQLPVLVLEKYLTSSYHDLWKSMITNERIERLRQIPCCGKNNDLDGQILRQWIHKLTGERLELKVRRYEDRLRDLVAERRLGIAERPSRYDEPPFGLNPEELPAPEPLFTQSDFTCAEPWEQLLYEGIMEALGYTKNQEPMQKLARALRLSTLASCTKTSSPQDTVTRLEAGLFQASGLLRTPMTGFDKKSREHLHHLRQIAAMVQPPYRGERMHPTEWKFFRLRPENFPTLRLAGAARLIAGFINKQFLKLLINALSDDVASSGITYKSIQDLFVVQADGFWETHYRFGERSAVRVQTLIGKSRADDIILNTIVPVALLYARIFKEPVLRRRIFRILNACPPSSSNTVLTTLETQLLHGKVKFDSAVLQQGALQLYKSYCLKERCDECTIGKIIFHDVGQ